MDVIRRMQLGLELLCVDVAWGHHYTRNDEHDDVEEAISHSHLLYQESMLGRIRVDVRCQEPGLSSLDGTR